MASKNSVTRQEVERKKSNIQWRQSCVGLWETWRLFRYENVLLFKHKIFATNARRSNVFTCLVLHNNKNINVKFSRSKIFFLNEKRHCFAHWTIIHGWVCIYIAGIFTFIIIDHVDWGHVVVFRVQLKYGNVTNFWWQDISFTIDVGLCGSKFSLLWLCSRAPSF